MITTTSNPPGAIGSGAEVLAFRLGAEEYGIDINKVQELRGYDAVTRIANAPAFIKGVVNLRGAIVPIMDLRIQFNSGVPRYDATTVVIILNMRARTVGMVVDSVSDVVRLRPDQIKPAPELGGAHLNEHLIGVGTLDDHLIMLLDIDQLLSGEQLGLIDATAPAVS